MLPPLFCPYLEKIRKKTAALKSQSGCHCFIGALHGQEELHQEQQGDGVGQDRNLLGLAAEDLDDGVGNQANADTLTATAVAASVLAGKPESSLTLLALSNGAEMMTDSYRRMVMTARCPTITGGLRTTAQSG